MLKNFIKVFVEYGIDVNETHFQRCLNLLFDNENKYLCCKGLTKLAEKFEDKGFSAAKMIRASLLACSNVINESEIKNEIEHSYNTFKAIINYNEITDFAYIKNGKWIFKDSVLFPDYYNLRVLAFTNSWKNDESIKILLQSITSLKKLQPIPNIYVKINSQLIATGSYVMHEFDTTFSDNDDNKKAEWLIRNEYFARMGVLKGACNINKSLESINNSNELINGICSVSKNYAFTNWGAYSGVSLEDNWMYKYQRINDLSFRIGLIKHYMKSA